MPFFDLFDGPSVFKFALIMIYRLNNNIEYSSASGRP